MPRRPVFPFVAGALAVLLAIPADTASAQEPPQRRPTLFEMLFGPRQAAPPPPPRELAPARRTTRRAAPASPPVATVEVTPKAPNARKILVVGDFVAGGLAWGLDQSFAEEPKIAVLDRANPNSGLVRDDYYDWPGVDIVVVVVGSNDRQQIRLGKSRLAPRSEAWEEAYVARVDAMVDTLSVYGRPFFWVSAPPMRSSAASRDMAYQNELYQRLVTEARGHFIDIWNGFTDENGRFISSGPDVDGQLRALRNNDGINFTRAGRLKLAFYVEREIRRQTGIGTGRVDLLASASQASHIEVGPDGVKRLVGPVISLSGPAPGASDVLAGGPDAVAPATTEESPQFTMIVKGEVLPAAPGRADDFSWPPGERAPAPASADQPVPGEAGVADETAQAAN
jgi:hypothetical protein